LKYSGMGVNAQAPRQRWLRYEISRLVTMRNLLLAAIIAAGTCGVVYAVTAALRPQSQALEDFAPAIANSAAAQEQGRHFVEQVPSPTRIFTPDSAVPSIASTAPGSSQKYYGVNGEKLIPITDEIRNKISEFLIQNGVLEGYDLYDVQQAYGFSIPNVVTVEQGPTWQHAVAIMPKNRLHHLYFFKYACGHQVTNTPDPYRDLMYAQPQHVADRYSKILCADCESMRKHLNTKRTSPALKGSE